ncbi:hypothetical protein BaRGS_00027575 [Batillaria attramentaria]|uniref:Uncharacterized protein n=1 Tax=Batillaria attramentaria TaxID=370345 RepID=A0ABD0K2Z3_9CAEN
MFKSTQFVQRHNGIKTSFPLSFPNWLKMDELAYARVLTFLWTTQPFKRKIPGFKGLHTWCLVLAGSSVAYWPPTQVPQSESVRGNGLSQCDQRHGVTD